jgi:hypothetical protein
MRRLTLDCSTLRIPRSICDWLLLLPFQPRPFHVQCYYDIPPLLLVPVNVQSLVHASYRIPLRARLGRLVWYSLDEHH